MRSALASGPEPVPVATARPARIVQPKAHRQTSGAGERYIGGVPMPRLCARIADWADEQGLSAHGGSLDMTGLMAAQFWIRPGWWVRTGIGAGNNLRGGADMIDPRRLGIATTSETGVELLRREHVSFELRTGFSTVTLSTRQVSVTVDLVVGVF